MALIFKKKILLAKIESTYGTDSTPTGASNAIETENMVITPLAGPTAARNVDRPYLGANLQIQTGQFVEITFDVGYAGSGTAATPPAWGPLLKACGFGETIAANVTYAPLSTAFPSLSMYFATDGQQHKILGARGDVVSLNLTPGEIPRISFRFMGLYSTPSSVADPTPTLTAWKTIKPINNANTPTFTIAAVARPMIAFTFALGNNLQYRNIVGGESVEIVDRAPSAQFSIEAPALSVKNYFTDVLASTLAALNIVHGVGAGNLCTLACPNSQMYGLSYEDAQGVTALKGSFAFIPGSGGNDECTIVTA